MLFDALEIKTSLCSQKKHFSMGCAPSKTPKMASAAALLGDPSDMDTCSTSMSWQGNSSVAHEISLPGSTLQQAHSLSGETLQNK